MTSHTVTWILFLVMSLVAPLFYYMFVIGGFVPLAGIAVLTLMSMLEPRGFWAPVFINLVEFAAYAYLLWRASRYMAKRAFTINGRFRIAIVISFIGAFLIGGLIPIFGIAHQGGNFQSVYSWYLGFWKDLVDAV